MRLRLVSRKAYEITRKEYVPLPGVSTLAEKFQHIHVSKGIIPAMPHFLRLETSIYTNSRQFLITKSADAVPTIEHKTTVEPEHTPYKVPVPRTKCLTEE